MMIKQLNCALVVVPEKTNLSFLKVSEDSKSYQSIHMKSHYGKFVEYTVRKKGVNISELARLTDVNRSLIYNWFNQENLKIEIIHRIGLAIKHDFSKDLPELFEESQSNGIILPKEANGIEMQYKNGEPDRLWKDRYITLLEKYHSFLLDFHHSR